MKKILTLILFSFLFNLRWVDGQEISMTLMSYNIYHGEQYYDNGKSNLQEIANLIKEINPDFVALQEVDSMTQRTAEINNQIPLDLVNELAEMTGMHGYFAKAIDFSNGGYGEGLLSKYPAEMSKIQLSTPQGGEGRALAMATFTMENGQKITFGATHLCHESEENRLAQIAQIIDKLDQFKHPTVIAGDLNFSPDESPYSILQKHYLDAAAVHGHSQPTIPYDDPTHRIDYIWLSQEHRWKITQVETIPVGFSDHMPLVVKVTLSP